MAAGTNDSCSIKHHVSKLSFTSKPPNHPCTLTRQDYLALSARGAAGVSWGPEGLRSLFLTPRSVAALDCGLWKAKRGAEHHSRTTVPHPCVPATLQPLALGATSAQTFLVGFLLLPHLTLRHYPFLPFHTQIPSFLLAQKLLPCAIDLAKAPSDFPLLNYHRPSTT